jgi:hypothetical protein
MAIVNLNKQEFSKTQYERVIDTSFSQLGQPVSQEPTQSISIEEFFTNYQEIFFDIPKFGEFNSHEYIVKTSGEYIEFTTSDDSITALIEEVTQLRQENLELNQQIVSLQTGSING